MLRKLRLDEEHQMSQVAADEPECATQFQISRDCWRIASVLTSETCCICIGLLHPPFALNSQSFQVGPFRLSSTIAFSLSSASVPRGWKDKEM